MEMELMNEQYLLDEVVALRRDMNWELALPTEMGELISTGGWSSNNLLPDSSSAFCLPQLDDVQNNVNYLLSSGAADNLIPFPGGASILSSLEVCDNGEYYPITNMEEEELGILEDEIHNLEVQASCCKAEPVVVVQSPETIPTFNAGARDYAHKSKKLQGQPSKNLMAERRRRKRLNDRLSMLRSIVPKISKMDRTAILADAIDYVKELLEKINNLQREIEVGDPNPNKSGSSVGILRDAKPNEYLVRNSPKFNVERRDMETRIEICCAPKPGLLLSTVHTLEALGLDIQHCVISCFNDFAIQASCSEEMEHRTMVSTDEVKQALFETAGYGGRCL